MRSGYFIAKIMAMLAHVGKAEKIRPDNIVLIHERLQTPVQTDEW